MKCPNKKCSGKVGFKDICCSKCGRCVKIPLDSLFNMKREDIDGLMKEISWIKKPVIINCYEEFNLYPQPKISDLQDKKTNKDIVRIFLMDMYKRLNCPHEVTVDNSYIFEYDHVLHLMSKARAEVHKRYSKRVDTNHTHILRLVDCDFTRKGNELWECSCGMKRTIHKEGDSK